MHRLEWDKDSTELRQYRDCDRDWTGRETKEDRDRALDRGQTWTAIGIGAEIQLECGTRVDTMTKIGTETGQGLDNGSGTRLDWDEDFV